MSDLFAKLQKAGRLRSQNVVIEGTKYLVKEMTTEELLRYQGALRGKTGGKGYEAAALLLSMTVWDPETEQLALTVDQALVLMQGSARAVTPLTRTAMQLAGLLDEEQPEPEPEPETEPEDEPREKKD